MPSMGSAWIGVSPTGFSAFAEKTKVGITAALKGVQANVPINAETKGALADIAALKARMEALNKLLYDARLRFDDAGMQAKLSSLQAKALNLAGTLSNLKLEADTTALDAKIAAIAAMIASLNRRIPKMKFGADVDAAIAKIIALKAEADLLTAKRRTIEFSIDPKGLANAEATLRGLEAAYMSLGDADSRLAGGFRLLTTTAGGFFGVLTTGKLALFGGIASIGLLHLALESVVEAAAVIIPALITMGAGLLAFGAAALLSGDSLGKINDHLKAIQTVSSATGAQISPLINKFNSIQQVIRPQVWQLYGDAINASGKNFGLVSKLAESTGAVLDRFAARIVVDLSTGAGGFQKFLSVGQRDLKALGTIALLVGNAIANLAKATERTHVAQTLTDILTAVARLVDAFTKLPAWLLTTTFALHGIYIWGGLAASVLLKMLNPVFGLIAAAGGITRTADAVANLGSSASRMDRLKAAASDLKTEFTQVGANLAGLGGKIRGAGTAAEGAAGKTGLWTRALGFFTGNAWTIGIAVGVAAITAFVIWTLRAKDATQKWIDATNKAVQNASLYTVINVTAAKLTQTTIKLADAQQTWNNTTLKMSTIGGNAAADIKDLTTEHNKLAGQLATETDRLGQIAKTYGTTLPGAMALASFAGVKVSDLLSTQSKQWATAMAQIAGVVSGYANMGQGLGQLGSDINAVSVASSDQLKAIDNLNKAWDSFTKNVSAPIDTFITFANSIIKFSTDASVAGAQMTGFGGAVQNMSKKVTTAALQLQQDFQSAFTAGNQLFDAMRTSQAPANQQIKAIKDTVAVLIPLAGTNKAAAAEISVLAQEAGGPATTNLRTLQKWAGVTAKQGMQGLQTDTNNAAVAMSNLSQDAQKLSNALQADLTAEMSKAIENAVGLQGAMDRYTKSLHDNGATAASTREDRKQLYNDLMSIFHNADQANAIIKTLSGAFTVNATAASTGHQARNQMLQDFAKQQQKAKDAWVDVGNYSAAIRMNGLNSDQAKAARKKLIDDLISAGVNAHTANTDVDNYTTAVRKNGLTSDAAKAARKKLIDDIFTAAGNSRQGRSDLDKLSTAVQRHGATAQSYQPQRKKLIDDLRQSGLNAKDAAGLVDGLITSLSHIPAKKTVGVYVQGQGAWTITQGSLQQKLTAGTKFGAAGGAIIPGYAPGVDKHLIAVSGGEGILVPEAVKAIGPKNIMAINHQYGSGRTPGNGVGGAFAGGGITASPATNYGGGFGALGPWVDARYGDTVAAGVNAVSAAMTKAINAAVTAANSFGTGTPGDIVSYAESFLGKIPYVFGGTSLAGMDCSAFTGMVLRHFGWNPPRTSEAQGSWVNKVPTPQSGGLAFYNSPGGGPPPGHVAIIANARQTVSQGGPGAGPNMGSTSGAMFYGVPPGGFASAVGNAVAGGGSLQQEAKALLQQHGWLVQWPAFNSLENREAGWNVNARNPSSGAYGLAQFINGPGEYAQYGGNSSTGMGQLVAMMNYIAQRYGDPNGAWAHELGFGWYDSPGGKIMPPGLSLSYNGTGRNEHMVPASSGHGGGLSADARAIINALERNTRATKQQGASFAAGLNRTSHIAASIGYYS